MGHLNNQSQTEQLTIVGPGGLPMAIPAGLWLAVEKFRQPEKRYRLVWVLGDQAWLCQENPTEFKKRYTGEDSAQAAAQALAKKFGVRLLEVTL